MRQLLDVKDGKVGWPVLLVLSYTAYVFDGKKDCVALIHVLDASLAAKLDRSVENTLDALRNSLIDRVLIAYDMPHLTYISM